jgi:hypothetical protein
VVRVSMNGGGDDVLIMTPGEAPAKRAAAVVLDRAELDGPATSTGGRR